MLMNVSLMGTLLKQLSGQFGGLLAPGWLEYPVLRSNLQISSKLESAEDRAALFYRRKEQKLNSMTQLFPPFSSLVTMTFLQESNQIKVWDVFGCLSHEYSFHHYRRTLIHIHTEIPDKHTKHKQKNELYLGTEKIALYSEEQFCSVSSTCLLRILLVAPFLHSVQSKQRR